MDATEMIQWKYIIASIIYTGIGLVIYILAFILLDVVTPRVAVWKEIVEKQNLALAVLLGSAAIGIAMIIASAIHG